MINKELIEKLAHDHISDTEMFLVDVKVDSKKNIQIFVDKKEGISIQECKMLSRSVETYLLENESEDFSLEVSSPGLDMPLRIRQQYDKNIGRSVEVTNNEGEKLEGVLLSADDSGFEIEVSKRMKVEGHKKKQLVVNRYKFDYDNVKSTKIVISFK